MGKRVTDSQADVAFAAIAEPRRPQVLELLIGTAPVEPGRYELIGAYRGEQLVAASGIEFSPGRTANLLGPRFVETLSTGEFTALVQAALDAAWRHDAVLVQALRETDADDETGRLLDAGFRRIADLLYLVSTPESYPENRPPLSVTLRSFDAREPSRLAALIERTYQGTQDCPVLNGVRATDDVVAGYRGVGEFRPENWLIVSDSHRDVGCLLLAEHPAFDQLELVYLGVIPEARGRGLGYALTRQAQWIAREASSGKLVLAVDADNAPALRIYAEAGFQSWDRRSVLVAMRPDSIQR